PGHATAGGDTVTFKVVLHLDVTDANISNQGDLGYTRPEFVKPDRVELIVLEGRDQVVFEYFPETAFKLQPEPPPEVSVLQGPDPALAQACDLTFPEHRRANRMLLHGLALAPPDLLVLHPGADVFPKILVRRLQIETVIPLGGHLEVRADLIPLVLGLL